MHRPARFGVQGHLQRLLLAGTCTLEARKEYRKSKQKCWHQCQVYGQAYDGCDTDCYTHRGEEKDGKHAQHLQKLCLAARIKHSVSGCLHHFLHSFARVWSASASCRKRER